MKQEKKQLKVLKGIKHFHSKSGKECLVITIESPCDLSRNTAHYSSYGFTYEDIFVPDELFNCVDPEYIGCSVELEYTVNWGKAYLCGINFVK